MRAGILGIAVLCMPLLAGAEPDRDSTPTELDPIEVEGRRDVLRDSGRARYDKIVPCIGDCANEPRAKSAAPLIVAMTRFREEQSDRERRALLSPVAARLDDKLP